MYVPISAFFSKWSSHHSSSDLSAKRLVPRLRFSSPKRKRRRRVHLPPPPQIQLLLKLLQQLQQRPLLLSPLSPSLALSRRARPEMPTLKRVLPLRKKATRQKRRRKSRRKKERKKSGLRLKTNPRLLPLQPFLPPQPLPLRTLTSKPLHKHDDHLEDFILAFCSNTISILSPQEITV